MEQLSKLHIYSLGKAAVNKERSSNKLIIVPLEHMLMVDGEISINSTNVDVTGTDGLGQTYATSMTTDYTIEADWLPLSPGGYQQTAPDIRRDERVLIWRFADSNNFFWTETGLDNHLRKLETVCQMYSDTTDEEDQVLNPNNSYVYTLSTHEGHVTFTTANTNGEPTRWAFQLNTKDGTFLLTEDNKNEVFIDAVNTYILITNADKSMMEFDKEDIRITCNRDLTITCGRDMEVNVGNNMTVNVANDQSITVGNNQDWNVASNVTGNVGSNYDITVGGNYTLKASDVAVTSPNSSFSGNVSVGGNCTVSGNISSGGNATVSGNLNASGKISGMQVSSSSPMSAPAYL